MTLPSTTSNPTIPQTLTPSQARALLHTLLSTTPNANSSRTTTGRTCAPSARTTSTNTTSPSKPTKTLRLAQPQQHTITIDASTRIIGHCNNLQLPFISAAEQASKIEELVKSALVATGSTTPENGDKRANFNITINAGTTLMGSKNTVVFGGNAPLKVVKGDGDSTAAMALERDVQIAGRKRRAQSEPVDMSASGVKKVKVEA